MDALQITTRRICDERIIMVFKLLGPSTRGQYEYEDFKDALGYFSQDAKTCARLASEIREAFSKWGKMVGELQAAAENQSGQTAIAADKAKVDAAVAAIEQTHATTANDEAKKRVTRAADNVDKQQKNLDKMIDKVPGPWAGVLQSVVTSFGQALPSIMAATIQAKTNPVGFAAGVAAGQAGGAAQNSSNASSGSQSQPASGAQNDLSDPAYATAALILDLVNHFYEYMGGDKGTIQWDKFREPASTTAAKDGDTQQGLAYILGTLKGQKANIDVTNTAPNKKLLAAYDVFIKVATDLQEHLRKQNQLTAKTNPEDKVLTEWKDKCKKARDDVLELAAVARAMGSSSLPQPFGKVQIPPPDLSAQTAQLNSAMQGVKIAQLALDNAEKAWERAVDKQEKTAQSLATVQAKLKRLQTTGKTLEEIKKILRDCVNVLADIVKEIDKLELFFTTLDTFIQHIVMSRVGDFENELGKAGQRAVASGVLRIADLTKQAIYTYTLQLKGYFSLLNDIAQMYSEVHRGHIHKGVELCYKLSKGIAANNPMPEAQEELAQYTESAAKQVAQIVNKKKDEILNTLRARARRAEEDTRLIEEEVKKYGVAIDQSTKKAIETGAQQQQAAAQKLLESDVHLVNSLVDDSEDMDASLA
jgi:hypothetical protein